MRLSILCSVLSTVKYPLQVEGTSYVIPNSHNVLSSPGFTARSPEYFSKPLDWEPHRWNGVNATGDDEQVDYGYGLVSKGAGSPYLPSGAGRHRCIGEQFAYVQLCAICVALVRELKFKKLPNVEDVPATNHSVSLINNYNYILCANIHPYSHCSQDPGQILSFNTREETRRLRINMIWLLLDSFLPQAGSILITRNRSKS